MVMAKMMIDLEDEEINIIKQKIYDLIEVLTKIAMKKAKNPNYYIVSLYELLLQIQSIMIVTSIKAVHEVVKEIKRD